MRKEAVNWDAIRRIGAGSGVGALATVLANRYLLGNKSTRSNILAGILGAGIGGGAGYLYHRKANKPAPTATGAKEQLQIDPEKLPPEARDYYHYLVAEANRRDAVQAKLKELEDTPMSESRRKELRHKLLRNQVAPGSSVTLLKPFEYVEAQKDIARYTNPRAIKAELATEMDNPNGVLNEKKLAADYEYMRKNHNMRMTKDQYAAVRFYHQRAYAIRRQATANYKARGDERPWSKYLIANPQIVDYIAYNSMPQPLQEQLTLAHRALSVQRAMFSNGASYYTDNLMFSMPEDADSKFNWYTATRTADTVANTATDAAIATAVGTIGGTGFVPAVGRLGVAVGGSIASKSLLGTLLPHVENFDQIDWGADLGAADTSNRGKGLKHMLWDKPRQNRITNDVMALMFSPAHMPQYSGFSRGGDPKTADKWRYLTEAVIASAAYAGSNKYFKTLPVGKIKRVPKLFLNAMRQPYKISSPWSKLTTGLATMGYTTAKASDTINSILYEKAGRSAGSIAGRKAINNSFESFDPQQAFIELLQAEQQ